MQVELIDKEDNTQLNSHLLDARSQRQSRESDILSTPKLKNQASFPSNIKKFTKKKSLQKAKTIITEKQTQMRLDELEQFQQTEPANNNFVFDLYDIWDLTYSLVNAKINKSLLFTLFMIQVIVRYFSILSLVYVTIKTFSEQWEWVFILIFTNTLYFICIVKISLKPAESQSQFILKHSFNSLQQNQAQDYFRVVSPRKLLTSILRGLVPPQFSCLYIKNSEKKAEIYAMINYLYSSIEAVIYYPFFAIYMFIIIKKQKQIDSYIIFYISFALICLSQIAFIIFSIYLVLFGCRKKGLLQKAHKKEK